MLVFLPPIKLGRVTADCAYGATLTPSSPETGRYCALLETSHNAGRELSPDKAAATIPIANRES
ncbi:hypothetical protein PGT21_005520 [Puccinia graminis f. sp. tritici]|uniref:Uncharacterized protein n=1 Tax=Puccinia graminis f. sp. tritici TaxID=56615 RepID=A0A5B0SGJ0_PUCGR|nr:hypothetical protein PGT21_005520 [Puccinia graminis f. sp. tritici]KAA1137286.1 hypothetical protein PGTUg99_017973 [Puccinia graminis f. sp. tritici]